MLDQFGGQNKLVAVVSDSYNLSNAVKNGWCGELKQQVIDSGTILVVRPDSGNPSEVVLRTLNELQEGYGCKVNDKGYKVLNNVRLIQGDSIDGPESIQKIYDAILKENWSGDNLAFGMGGGSLQQVNRDTLKFAMKLSAIQIGDEWKDAFKEPSDAPWKASRGGRLNHRDLSDIWIDSEFIKEYGFHQVRINADEQFKI
ncbi:hypothetical protein M0R04_04330 [Candidatus Dojkabacteria bacterium]|jgi:nicotinamide phosphoribosyltransferase|nr:hypothetical protein [Candidatus Dojkabacteria bacterium]